jgi:hypothetical protein
MLGCFTFASFVVFFYFIPLQVYQSGPKCHVARLRPTAMRRPSEGPLMTGKIIEPV